MIDGSKFAAIRTAVGLLLTGEGMLNASATESWSQFRGPNGQGVVHTKSFPAQLDIANQLQWKIQTSPGNSSPIILDNGSIVLTGHESGKIFTYCFNSKSGREKWKRELAIRSVETAHSPGRPAVSTPVTAGDKIFVFSGSFGLISYDHDGRTLWSKPLTIPTNTWGCASSPILSAGNLIQLADTQGGKSFLMAVNPKTGDTVWSVDRSRFGSSWSTPVVWNTSRGEELVILGSRRLDSYNPKNGELQWRLNGFPDNGVTVPIIHGNKLIVDAFGLGSLQEFGFVPRWKDVAHLDTDHDGKLRKSDIPPNIGWQARNIESKEARSIFFPSKDDFEATDKNGDGFVTEAEWEAFIDKELNSQPKNRMVAFEMSVSNHSEPVTVWESNKGVSEVPSPALYQSRLYSVRDGGVLTCLDANSGKLIYQERLPNAGGQYLASPIIAAVGNSGFLVAASVSGVISVIETGDTFRIASQLKIDSQISATPAIDVGQNRIYIRTENSLLAFCAQ